MKKSRYIIAVLLFGTIVAGSVYPVYAWDYENNSPVSSVIRNYDATFLNGENEHSLYATRMYYNSKTNDIFMVDKGIYKENKIDNVSYYLYGYSADKLAELFKNNICYHSDEHSYTTHFYDNSGSEISEGEFEKTLLEFENNKELISVDLSQGMQTFSNSKSSVSNNDRNFVVTDYSNVRNYTLDPKDNTSATLMPKIMLYGTDIDLKVTWKSSDSRIAEVDSEGKVTAKAEGSCTVTSEIEGIGAVETYNITVEPYMTETEKAVRTIIKNYDSGSITEKDMFNQVYALDEYNAAGHVITDIDGDDQYEMVTRSPDKKVIKIYERSGDNIVLAKTLTGVDRANMLYVHNNGSVNVFFQTVKNITANKKEIKIFGYKGAESMMSNPLVCSIEKNVNDSTDYLCYDSNGNKFDVLYGTDEYSYLYNSWRESFNDNCYTVSPETQTQAVCSGEGDSWGETIDIWGNFISNYYNENDRESIFEDHGYSLRPALIQQMAINEIIGRYNYKFQDPESTALFNKNSSYNPDPSITKEDIFAKFNEYEKFNYDHLGLITGGQA